MKISEFHLDFAILPKTIKKAKKNKSGNNDVESNIKRKYTGDSKMKKLEMDMENLKVETVSKSISTTIREQRTKLNMKQKDLANKINVPVTTIQQYENGKSQTDIKILIKLEKALRCKLTGKGFTK